MSDIKCAAVSPNFDQRGLIAENVAASTVATGIATTTFETMATKLRADDPHQRVRQPLEVRLVLRLAETRRERRGRHGGLLGRQGEVQQVKHNEAHGVVEPEAQCLYERRQVKAVDARLDDGHHGHDRARAIAARAISQYSLRVAVM